MAKDWTDIVTVVTLLKEKEMKELTAIATRIAQTNAKLAELDDEISRQATAFGSVNAMANVGFSAWLAKTRIRKVDLLQELAQLKANKESQIAKTRKAVGRSDAISRLIAKETEIRKGTFTENG